MSDSHAGQTQRLSRRAFLIGGGATLALMAVGTSRVASIDAPASTISAMETPSLPHRTYLPIVEHSCPATIPTPRPMRIVFNGDFERPIVYAWASGEWHTPMKIAGDYEVIPDPTNSMNKDGKPRGNVLKLWVSGPALPTDWDPSRYWRTIFPSWMKGENRTVRAPSAIKVDIFVPSSVHAYIGVLGVHRYNTVTGDKDSVAAFEIDEMGIPVLYVNDGKGNGERVKLKSGLFLNGEWNTLELVLEPNGDVTPLVNEVIAYQNKSDQLRVPVGDYPAGFCDGHAGIIAANPAPDDGMDGLWILNDNFEILEYEC
jgi:hypothetical protein